MPPAMMLGHEVSCVGPGRGRGAKTSDELLHREIWRLYQSLSEAEQCRNYSDMH